MDTSQDKRLLMVFSLDMAAHYLRCIELCKRMKDEFHIVFAASRRYGRFVSESGFETFDVENFESEEVATSASSFDFSWLNPSNIERVLTSQIRTIAEYKPSVVLGDAAFTLKMAAEKTGVPFVSLVNGYMTPFYGLTRKVSPSHFAYQYSKTIPARVFDSLTRRIEHIMFRRIHAPFRSARSRHKLSRRSYFLQELEGDFNLICDLPSLFPQKKLPAKYEFVGPLFHKGSESEIEIQQFLEADHPKILISMGSTGKNKIVDLFGDATFKDFRIVVSGNGSDSIFGGNILSKSFVNHIAILDKIDVVICHGGNGTIYQALSKGVPALCFPSNFEQEWNIQRVTETGLGARIDESSSAADVRRLVDFWIDKKSGHVFDETKESIRSFVGKPVSLNKKYASVQLP
jgi:UDP:flavonoid glycosyltransferase YjiC (YdhE family)